MNQDKIADNLLAMLDMRGEFTEADLRALRDRVFKRPSTNANWEYVKNNWAKPKALHWLKEKSEQPL